MQTRTIAGKLAFVLCSALMACPSAYAKRYNIRWVLVHEPSQVVEQAAKDFAARLDKRTNGDLHVEVLTRSEYKQKYNHGEAISQKSAMEDVNAGKLEMCQAYSHTLGNYAHHLWVLDMPYLFRDYDHAERTIEGPIGADLRNQLQASSNMKALAITYSGGLGVFATTHREVRRPEDMSGLRVTIANTPVFRGIARELDLEPIVVPPEGFVPLAQKELVDASEITPARFEELQLYKAAKVLVNTNHFMLTSMVVMNKKFFDSLPAEYQKIIQEEIQTTARMERQRSIEANRAALANMKRYGVKVIDLTDEQTAAFKRRLTPLYEHLAKIVGKTTLAAIRETKAGPLTAQR